MIATRVLERVFHAFFCIFLNALLRISIIDQLAIGCLPFNMIAFKIGRHAAQQKEAFELSKLN